MSRYGTTHKCPHSSSINQSERPITLRSPNCPPRPARHEHHHHILEIGLQAVEVPVEGGDVLHEALPLAHFPYDLVRLGALGLRISAHLLPVVEHALREGFAAGVGAKVLGEAERLHNGKVRLQRHHGGSRALLLSEHVSATLGQHTVAAAHRVLRARDLAQEHRLKEHGGCREHRRVHHATGGGHDLAHTTVDGIGVENHIQEVEPHSADLNTCTKGLQQGDRGDQIWCKRQVGNGDNKKSDPGAAKVRTFYRATFFHA